MERNLFDFCMGGSRGDGGGAGGADSPPPEKSQKKEFLSKTGLDPSENRKATKLAFNVGPYLPTSETPFKWRFAGRSMMARL